MAKFLWQASYTAQGASGLLKEGGSGRREAVRKAVDSVGGTLEAIYFAFGSDDVIVIAEFPDNATCAGVSLAVSATGMVNLRTTVLLTPEEVDAGARLSPTYRPPGAPQRAPRARKAGTRTTKRA